jgi:hypothetical protein
LKNLIFPLYLLFLAIVVFNSCEKQKTDNELMNSSINIVDPTYVSFVSPINTFTVEPDSLGEFYNNIYEISIMTVGSIRPYDISLGYEIETIIEIEDTINAISGIHYELSADSFIILANSTEGKIYIALLYKTLPFAKSVILKLNLIPGVFDTVPYFSSQIITLLNPYNVNSDISVFLGAYTCDEEGYGMYYVNFISDPVVENRIHNDNFWDWAYSGATIYYDFSGDSSQTIVIPSQSFTFGDGVVGSVDGVGNYNLEYRTFSCTYNVWYEGTNYPSFHYFYPAGGFAISLKTGMRTKAEIMKN